MAARKPGFPEDPYWRVPGVARKELEWWGRGPRGQGESGQAQERVAK